jgi:uncharacterized protein
MSADVNIKTIQNLYEAFGRGDVAFILDNVTDDVDWQTDSATQAGPWYGAHNGKDGVVDFFVAFGSAMDVERFEPFSYAANDSEVHTMVRLAATRRANGKSLDMNLHHFFQFRDGLISYYRGTEDSAQTEAIFRD